MYVSLSYRVHAALVGSSIRCNECVVAFCEALPLNPPPPIPCCRTPRVSVLEAHDRPRQRSLCLGFYHIEL